VGAVPVAMQDLKATKVFVNGGSAPAYQDAPDSRRLSRERLRPPDPRRAGDR